MRTVRKRPVRRSPRGTPGWVRTNRGRRRDPRRLCRRGRACASARCAARRGRRAAGRVRRASRAAHRSARRRARGSPSRSVAEPHAPLERIVRIGLAQDRHAPAQPVVVRAVARQVVVGEPTLLTVSALSLRRSAARSCRSRTSLAVARRARGAAARGAANRARGAAPRASRRERRRVRQRVAVVAAVGGVQVHEDVRIPRVEQWRATPASPAPRPSCSRG